MYESFYGLQEKPFELLPDPDFLYMSEGHEDAYTHLDYAIQEGKGFVVVTGEIGAGKTTLVNLLLESLPQQVEVAVISNTGVAASHLVRLVCQEFGLETKGLEGTELLDAFKKYLLEQYGYQRRVVLVVDEAQNLNLRAIEEIRLLSNLEADRHHLLQIILVGQPELRRKLKEKGLEQFLQRISAHCHLDALNPKEVGNYIRHRLEVAGANRLDLFDRGAIERVAEYSLGIPRVVNLLCDSALVSGYADGLHVITEEVIKEIAQARAAGGLLPEVAPGAGEPETADSAEMVDETEERLCALEGRTREMLRALEEMKLQIAALNQADERLATAFETLLRRTREHLKSLTSEGRPAPQPGRSPSTRPPASPRDEKPREKPTEERTSLLSKLVNRR